MKPRQVSFQLKNVAFPQMPREGFTLIEISVVVGIIAVLVILLFPSMAKMREQAQSAACQQNLKKIGQGMIQYSADHQGFFPPHWGGNPTMTWYGFVAPYITDWDGDASKPMNNVFFCPATAGASRTGKTYTSTYGNGVGQSYGYNYYFLTQNSGAQQASHIRRTQAIKELSKVVLVVDIPVILSDETGVALPGFCRNYLQYPALAELSERHPGKSCNLVFGDGHVENRNTRRMVTPGEDFYYPNWDPR